MKCWKSRWFLGPRWEAYDAPPIPLVGRGFLQSQLFRICLLLKLSLATPLACIYVCMHVCIYAYMHVCKYVCLYVCVYVYVRTCAYNYLSVHLKLHVLVITRCFRIPSSLEVFSCNCPTLRLRCRFSFNGCGNGEHRLLRQGMRWGWRAQPWMPSHSSGRSRRWPLQPTKSKRRHHWHEDDHSCVPRYHVLCSRTSLPGEELREGQQVVLGEQLLCLLIIAADFVIFFLAFATPSSFFSFFLPLLFSSFFPFFLPSVFPSFFPSFLPSFLPYLLPFFLPSSFMPSFLYVFAPFLFSDLRPDFIKSRQSVLLGIMARIWIEVKRLSLREVR